MRIFTLLSIFLLCSCNPSKQLVKKGKELETHGMYYEAVDFYLRALSKKPTNVEAKVEAKKAGQRVLDDMMVEFYQAYTNSSNKQAVYSYLEARGFHDRLKAYNIKLEFPYNYEGYFDEVKSYYLKSLYDESLESLEKENFATARQKLDEIEKLEPEYEKTSELKLFAKIEPEYRKGIDLFDSRDYRSAYKKFQYVKGIDGDYKDVDNYIEQSLSLGIYTIGLADFKNHTPIKGMDDAIASAFVSDMLNSQDPFLKIIDRSSVDDILKEQKLGMDERFDPKSVADAGRILGAKALITGNLVVADEKEGRIYKERRKGYIGHSVKRKDRETGKVYTEMEYDKVYYYEYFGKNEVSYTFNYKLISTETGEIIYSDNIEVNKSDDINYINYNGNTRYLYAGNWNSLNSRDRSDQLFNSFSQKRELDRKVSARRDLRSVVSMRQDAIEKIANRMAVDILKYQD